MRWTGRGRQDALRGLLLALCLLLAPCMARAQVRISFAGDCTLGTNRGLEGRAEHFVKRVEKEGFDWPFLAVKDIFEADDLTLVNLENAFTTGRRGADKRCVFSAPPSYAEILPLGGVEAVNTANNHSHDYGVAGYEDTLRALDAQDVVYCGTKRPAYVEVGGELRVALLGRAAPKLDSLSGLLGEIRQAKKDGCDLVIVSLHWGIEYEKEQNIEQKRIAHKLVQGGADVIVGHHPHILQGIEIYKGVPIFYSLGNFCFGGNIDPPDWDTMIVQITAEKAEEGARLTSIKLIPCRISDATGDEQDFQPVPVRGERAEEILKKVARYSRDVPEELFEVGETLL